MKNGAKPKGGLAVLYDRASTIGQRNNWSRDDARRFLDRVAAEHGYEPDVRQEIAPARACSTGPS